MKHRSNAQSFHRFLSELGMGTIMRQRLGAAHMHLLLLAIHKDTRLILMNDWGLVQSHLELLFHRFVLMAGTLDQRMDGSWRKTDTQHIL